MIPIVHLVFSDTIFWVHWIWHLFSILSFHHLSSVRVYRSISDIPSSSHLIPMTFAVRHSRSSVIEASHVYDLVRDSHSHCSMWASHLWISQFEDVADWGDFSSLYSMIFLIVMAFSKYSLVLVYSRFLSVFLIQLRK